MKANELMIGDWVYDTILKCNTRVELLSMSGIRGDCNDNVWDEKTFEPIPLTPEILEKNGFKKDKETDQWYFDSNVRLDMGILAIGIDDGCGVGICVMRNGAITYYCKYVHELQHFLRLIGGAKEIEL